MTPPARQAVLSLDSELSGDGVVPQAPYDADGFEEDASAHLGLSHAAVDEHNRHLDQLEPLLERAVAHLYLKAVAIRLDPVEPDRQQRLARKRLVPRR